MDEVLLELGLKQAEIRVYVALLELGEVQTGRICEKTKIASSNIYPLLQSLVDKGLVGFNVKNNTRHYVAAPPRQLQTLLEEKQKALAVQENKLKQTIANLEKINQPEEESTYKYFEGISGIKGMWHELNETMSQENPVYVYTADAKAYEHLIGFYNEHHKIRTEKNIKEKMIFPQTDKQLAQQRENSFTEIKFADLQNKAEWGVIEDKLYILHSRAKQPKGFLIQDKIIAETFKQVFEQIWSKQD